MADDQYMLTVGCISRIKSIAEALENRETFTAKVLSIFRYTVDNHFPIVDCNSTDAFDVVVSDGRYKTKCLLSTTLNDLVYKRNLQENSVISVTSCSCYVDEESLEDRSYVILQGVEILSLQSTNLPDSCEEIEFCEHATFREKQAVPLAANRGYYLPLWNDEDFFGAIWNSDPDLVLRKRIEKSITISDLGTFWKTLSLPYPGLIGRIVGKSRLNHYGKSTDEKNKYPYQAYFEIEDRSATVSICLWNSFCVKFYNYLHVGDAVAVLNYRVGRKFAQRSNAVYNTSDAVNIEISVNPSSPQGEIYKLAPEDLGPALRVPDVPYRFIDRKSMTSYSSSLICDVVGVVMFVSQEIREKKINNMSFWVSKWIHLQDGTSPLPIILRLYASSQPDVFSAIVPGNILMCARMLLRIKPLDSRHRKFCFLTTTRESQICVLKQPSDVNNKPFRGCGIVGDVIKWRQSHDAKQFLRRSCSGGFYSFPPLPDSLESYKRTFSVENPIELTNTVNLGMVLKQLHFRQHVRLHIQGVVAAIEFVPLDSEGGLSQSSGEILSSQASSVTQSSTASGETSSIFVHTTQSSQSINERKLSSSGKESDDQQEQSGSQYSQNMTEELGVKRKHIYRGRVNPPRTCKQAHRTSDEELSGTSSEKSSEDLSEEHTESLKEKSELVSRRVNPRRKCKKDVLRRSPLARKTGRKEKMSNERKGMNPCKNAASEIKKRANDVSSGASQSEASMETPEKKTLTEAGRSERVSAERGAKTTETEERSLRFFPYRILDQKWKETAPDLPTYGLSHSHRDSLPRYCSRECSGREVIPRADRQGFVSAEGYWRLLIVGLNRQAVVSAMFMPQSSNGEVPRHGVFLSALAKGMISNDYSLETLLDRASEELRERRTVFVLDVYSHGQGEVEVVINRAY